MYIMGTHENYLREFRFVPTIYVFCGDQKNSQKNKYCYKYPLELLCQGNFYEFYNVSFQGEKNRTLHFLESGMSIIAWGER